MISGGGTGGHIYPAISIAQSLQSILTEVDILFVGAEGKMEMRKVPEAGFKIVGLWISGIQRSLSLQNLMFPFKLISSLWKAFKLIKSFKPDAVIGVGGYASGPLLFAASFKKVPCLIQEQNSYAGLTNKLLASRVDKICVAHEGMEKYFPKEKLVVTGNPVRSTISGGLSIRPQAMEHFELNPDKKTVLIVGGSLGARSVNEMIMAGLPRFLEKDIQVIWQTGGYYYQEMLSRVGEIAPTVKIFDFISEMKLAYAAADVVISRAGALSIAELMLTGKPSILVPSPNVAEDHQTINARALVDRDAAIMVKDEEGIEKLVEVTIQLLSEPEKQNRLAENIKKMAHPNASNDIANEVIKMLS